MNSLPTELNLKIIHHVRDSTPILTFSYHSIASMEHADAYNEFLLMMALYHRHWTSLAQSELFHHIILKDGDKTRLLLHLLRASENDGCRTYAERASSIRFGYHNHFNLHCVELREHLDKLAGYCPNVVEISCYNLKNASFSDFRRYFSSQAETRPINASLAQKTSRAQRVELAWRVPRCIRLILAYDHSIIGPV